jgi:acetyl-CoA carboxylase biotin carboxyl carrier protein
VTGPGDTEAVLSAVDILAPAFEASGLAELEVQVGELQVRMAKPAAVAPVAPAAPESARQPAVEERRGPYGEPAPGMRFVTAPLTGVWYDAPSPGARPYISEGSEIGAGSVIGLIEAMKLFNEIKSDIGGQVHRILVESGTLVKRQQPLLEVDPS